MLTANGTPLIVTILLGALVYTLSVGVLTVLSRRRQTFLVADA